LLVKRKDALKRNIPKKNGFPERLGIAVGKSSLRDFANLVGISYSVLYQYLNGKSEPTRPVLLAISNKTGISVEWLVSGLGSPTATPGEDVVEEVASVADYVVREGPGEEFASLPVLEMAAGGQRAKIDRGRLSEAVVFGKSWLRTEFGVSPRFLCLLEVRGESMEPTLKPGELVLINRSDAGNVSDGLFAVRLDQVLLVKRLQRIPGGGIRLSSDNERYESFTISLQEPQERFAIIGRVIWHGRKL
jgi:phage repressor protein C with HTH and peptisase S24 domain